MIDFQLDELWRVSTTVELPGKFVATVKAVGDIDNRQVEEFALAERIRFKRHIEDETSEEHLSLIEPWKDQTPERMIEQVCYSYETMEAIPAAIRAHPNRFVGEQDDATPELKADSRKEQERVDKEIDQKRRASAAVEVEAFRASMQRLDPLALFQYVKEYSQRLYADARYYDARKWCAIFLSTYDGNGRRIFRSAEEVQHVPPQVVALLHAAYISVNSKDPWSLEKAVLRKN